MGQLSITTHRRVTGSLKLKPAAEGGKVQLRVCGEEDLHLRRVSVEADHGQMIHV